METVCAGSHCKKAEQCRLYWANMQSDEAYPEYTHADYSVEGDYTVIDGDTMRIVGKCGDRGGYRLFEAK